MGVMSDGGNNSAYRQVVKGGSVRIGLLRTHGVESGRTNSTRALLRGGVETRSRIPAVSDAPQLSISRLLRWIAGVAFLTHMAVAAYRAHTDRTDEYTYHSWQRLTSHRPRWAFDCHPTAYWARWASHVIGTGFIRSSTCGCRARRAGEWRELETRVARRNAWGLQVDMERRPGHPVSDGNPFQRVDSP